MQQALVRSVESAANLMPGAFALAADVEADIKERWTALDTVYAYVVDEMERRGTPLRPAVFSHEGLTERQVEELEKRSLLMQVALSLLVIAYGNAPENHSLIVMQAGELVPTNPDPDTGRAGISLKDQAVLYEGMKVLREELPDDWACFFKGDSEPVERRRVAFQRLYACLVGVWREESDYARFMPSEQRQKFIIFSFMCCVPNDQWGSEDLERLFSELLPIPEPDWDALSSPQ